MTQPHPTNNQNPTIRDVASPAPSPQAQKAIQKAAVDAAARQEAISQPHPTDELREIYERCDVSNNGTDNPMSFEEFREAIHALLQDEILKARIKTHEQIRAIHMAHDWNETSDDLRKWLMADLHNIQRLQTQLTKKKEET